ncbi:MAG: DNA polymerase III subunit delta [Thermodesulfobacteriota bacterium]
MSHPILERHLERRRLRPLYLFYGEEEFLMERAWRRLAVALEEQTGEAPLKIFKDSQEVGLEDFLAQARVAPLWGSGQLLILRRAEAYPDTALKAVFAYLEHPSPRCWVILLAEGLKAKEVKKHPLWSRLQKDEAALGFFRLREGELHQWLTQEARRLDKTLTLAAAQRLVEMVGLNLAELTQELAKLALFAGTEKTLTPQLVAQLASHSRTYNIFALVEALGDPGLQRRLAALDHLLDLGEPPAKILGMLARQLRLLIRFKEAPAGTSTEALAGKLHLPPGLLKKLSHQAAHFTLAALQSHLYLLHQADLHLKTSTGNPRLWLEWALLQMGPG